MNINLLNAPVMIPLTNGGFVFVDDSDYEKVNKLKWRKVKDRNRYYAVSTTVKNKNTRTYLKLHRYILNAPDGILVDHNNGNGLDDRRQNIRLCNESQNNFNRELLRNNTTGMTGIYYMKKGNKRWWAYIWHNSKRHGLGCYFTKEDAIIARIEAEKKYFGEFSKYN